MMSQESRIPLKLEEVSESITDTDGKDLSIKQAADYNYSLVYRPPTSHHHLLISDKYLIEKYLKCKWEDAFIILINDEKKCLYSKLENVSHLLGDMEYRVVGNRWKKSSNNLFRIPNTEIMILSREYGFIFNKKYFDVVSNFIESISLSPTSFDEELLNKVYWNEKTKSLKNDILFFSNSKHWFDKRDLPYARSYLLYGPPGNGKTSVIRAISRFFGTSPSQFSFTARYEDPDSTFLDWVGGDEARYSSEAAEEWASNNRRSISKDSPRIRILMLEDIDRFFSNDEGFKTGVSFSTILNALDGVAQRKNSIIIATANNPEKIDSQVLFRPGRFDLRVPFDPPSKQEIASFLTKLSEEDALSQEAIVQVADLSVGHSLAFIKGIYMAAANRAFSRSSQLIGDDDILLTAKEFFNNMGRSIKSNKSGAGF